MASEEILRLARAGDPTVLTSLLNHVLKPYGITATVVRHEIRLEIQLVASRPVDEAAVTQLVHQVVRKLDIQYIPTVAIAQSPTTPQHSSPESLPPQESPRNWPQSATHNSVAWRQEKGGISTAESTADATADATANASADASANVLPQSAALPPVLSPMSAIQTPDPQGHPDPSIDPVALDESLNIFPPPSEPLFEDTPTASPGAASPIAVPSDEAPDEAPKSDLWQRPEAVILVAYLLAVIIWQLYVDLTAESSQRKSGWTATALAERLGISRTTLSRRKYREDFSAWTQSLDPDGLAWMYVGPRFSPVSGVDVLPEAPR